MNVSYFISAIKSSLASPTTMAFPPSQPLSTTHRAIDRVLAVLDQKDRPVAQKMRTGLYYFEVLVLGKNRLKFFVLIYSE